MIGWHVTCTGWTQIRYDIFYNKQNEKQNKTKNRKRGIKVVLLFFIECDRDGVY